MFRYHDIYAYWAYQIHINLDEFHDGVILKNNDLLEYPQLKENKINLQRDTVT